MFFAKSEIKKVAIIGLGALGILFGSQINRGIGDNLTIIADLKRIERYLKEGVYANDEKYEFNYKTPEEGGEAVDLIIFAVKMKDLKGAIVDVEKFVGPDTLFLSLLNGIISEEMIAEKYGEKNIIWAVAQGMDALKTKNHLKYSHPGLICFGDRNAQFSSEKVKKMSRFFDKVKIPYEVNNHMDQKRWSKLLLNVGVNQVLAIYGENYGDLQKKGEPRQLMIKAMEEVILIAKKEGISLSQDDINYWMKVIDNLHPAGKPSMRQDIDARRETEVELFSGTILKLGEKYKIETKINQMLYEKIKKIDLQYLS